MAAPYPLMRSVLIEFPNSAGQLHERMVMAHLRDDEYLIATPDSKVYSTILRCPPLLRIEQLGPRRGVRGTAVLPGRRLRWAAVAAAAERGAPRAPR